MILTRSDAGAPGPSLLGTGETTNLDRLSPFSQLVFKKTLYVARSVNEMNDLHSITSR
jgi:hypothetical protein